MKKYLKLKTGYVWVFPLLLAYSASAQFSSGSSFHVAPGTMLFVDSLTFQPAAVALDLVNTNITHSYTPVPPAGPGLGSIARVYEVNPAMTFRGTAGLYYKNSELNGNTGSQLSFVYNDGVNGYGAAGVATINNINNYVVATTGINTITFTKITSVDNGVPLPVHLLSFNVKAEGRKARLDWVTANEFNCDRFEVERSGDGTQFSYLTTEAAKGSIAGEHDYQLYDETPLAGWNYYRLKQVDRDGKASYSSTESVFFGAGTGVSVYPNPFTTKLRVTMNVLEEGKEKCSLLDVSGRVISMRELILKKGANTFELDFSAVANGTYWLKIGALFNTQVVKQ